MRWGRSYAGLCAAGLLLASCASKKPAEAPKAAEIAAAAPEPAPDLSPVAAPADVIAVARVHQPSALVDTLVSWAALPVDWRALLADGTPGADRVLALNAPIDAVVALSPTAERSPEVLVALSVGLSSYDAAIALAKAQGKRLREVAPGIQRLAGEGESACAIAAAVGSAPARLVCSPEPEHLEQLLPYMVRGLPRETIGTRDLHAELRLEPLRRRFANQLRQLKAMGVPMLLHELALDVPGFDRALAEAAHGLMDEVLALSDDITHVELDLTRIDDQNAELSFALHARGERSWLLQTLRASSARMLTPPEAFWRLPADADFAGYGAGSDPARSANLRRTLRELLVGFLASEKLTPKTVDGLAGVIDLFWAEEAAASWAHGTTATAGKAASLRERVAARLGWYVFAIEKDVASYRQRLDALARAVSSKEFRGALAKRFELAPDQLPSLKLAAAQGLPKGSAQYELVLPGGLLQAMEELAPEIAGKPEAPGSTPRAAADRPTTAAKGALAQGLTVSMLLVPDAPRTWFVVASDAKLARAKLEVVRAGTEKGLVARQGLEPLRTMRVVSGGYLTLKALLSSVPGAASVLTGAPGHGEVPMLFWSTVAATGNPAVRSVVRVPRSSVRDIAASAAGLSRVIP